jgi:NitT/TauT family transport system permease protein
MRLRPSERLRNSVWPTFSVITCLVFWQGIVTLFAVPKYLLPSPASVLAALVSNFWLLAYHTWITLFECALAFVLCLAVGVPLAIGIASLRWVEKSVYPLLVVSQAVPKVAIAPLLLVWIGFGMETKILIAVLISFFPIVISTVVGLKGLPTEMVELGSSMGLTAVSMFRKIRLPHALPSMFGGIKVAATFTVVGAVVGEFVGADKGLGYLLLFSSGQMQMDLMFADVIILGALGITLFWIVEWTERRLLPWHVSVRNELVPMG